MSDDIPIYQASSLDQSTKDMILDVYGRLVDGRMATLLEDARFECGFGLSVDEENAQNEVDAGPPPDDFFDRFTFIRSQRRPGILLIDVPIFRRDGSKTPWWINFEVDWKMDAGRFFVSRLIWD